MHLFLHYGTANIEDLARKAYGLGAQSTDEQVRSAANALLAANPHLENIEQVPAGAVLAAPETPGLTPDASTSVAATLGAEVARVLHQQLPALQSAVRQSLELEQVQLDADLRLLESEEVQAAMKENNLDQQLAQLVNEKKAEMQQAQQLTRAEVSVLQGLDADLNDWLKILGLG
jgi:hypothetical protein